MDRDRLPEVVTFNLRSVIRELIMADRLWSFYQQRADKYPHDRGFNASRWREEAGKAAAYTHAIYLMLGIKHEVLSKCVRKVPGQRIGVVHLSELDEVLSLIEKETGIALR